MTLVWIVIAVLLVTPVAMLLRVTYNVVRARILYIPMVARIFVETPLFLVPKAQPDPRAEDLRIRTSDGLTLAACWIPPRSPLKGVILFGIEFGSNRWSCLHYCQSLLDAGYAIFAYEPRNQGESDALPGYNPLHWVTSHELIDARAAMDYVAKRPETQAMGGYGIFGISRGGSALMFLAGGDPLIQCAVTDGIYPTYSLMLPYIRQWISIYIKENAWLHDYLPDFVCGWFALAGIHRVENERKIHIPYLERNIGSMKNKPFFMIHGGDDRYIKPEVARKMFDLSRGGKRKPVPAIHELWMIDKAKHNEGILREPEEYPRRVRAFLDRHLARRNPPSESSNNAAATPARNHHVDPVA